MLLPSVPVFGGNVKIFNFSDSYTDLTYNPIIVSFPSFVEVRGCQKALGGAGALCGSTRAEGCPTPVFPSPFSTSGSGPPCFGAAGADAALGLSVPAPSSPGT